MYRTNCLHKLSIILVLLSLALTPFTSVFAQAVEGTPTPTTTDDTTVIPEKGEFTPGESSSIDSGKSNIFIPLVTSGSGNNVDAASPSFSWQVVFLDELCSFPSSWTVTDRNGTNQRWTRQTVSGYCTAKPNMYTNKMNTYMERTFSLVSAVDARLTFRFKMNTESTFDFLRYEYSCNGGKSWTSRSVHAESGPVPFWTVRTVSLTECIAQSSVIVRFTFDTDDTVTGSEAPVIDYVKVEKLWL